MKKRLIGWLLWTANANPPTSFKKEFYFLKDRILKKYGEKKGVDIQHIQKECWTCNGSGEYDYHSVCRICGGRGIYQEFWTVLQRYQFGEFIFHLPLYERLHEKPPQRVTIEGFIEHERPKYYLYDEAFFWLCLLFDPKLFFKALGKWGCISKKYTPLVIISTWLFWIKCFPNVLKKKLIILIYKLKKVFNKKTELEESLPF